MGDQEWLGLQRVEEALWRLAVTEGVVAGSSSLYGGCATAAALATASTLTEQTPRWAATHFTGLARLGSTVELRAEMLGAGRTMTHVRVDGTADDGRVCFSTRATFGDRPAVVDGWKRAAVDVGAWPGPDDCDAFDHPAHAGTFAERIEWRLVPRDSTGDLAAWWARPADATLGPVTVAAVLADYVTYGIGRACGEQIGGLSIDNTLRFHDTTGGGGWYVVAVEADALDGAFGTGTAHVTRSDGSRLATGAQTMVLNGWNWKVPGE